MNEFRGEIIDIEVSGRLSLVSVNISDYFILKSIVIETPETADYLSKKTQIKVLFKETEVILFTDNNITTSIENRIEGTIKRIEKGVLLSKVEIATKAGELVSIISTSAVNKLGLKHGTNIISMVQLNEIMLSE
jgi:molybdopterin-binding protein